MKSFLTAIALSIASFFLYKHYGKWRDSAAAGDRGAGVRADARQPRTSRAAKSRWRCSCARPAWPSAKRRRAPPGPNALESCPTCKLQAPKCQEQLSPRYARLFDERTHPFGLSERDRRQRRRARRAHRRLWADGRRRRRDVQVLLRARRSDEATLPRARLEMPIGPSRGSPYIESRARFHVSYARPVPLTYRNHLN